MTDFSKEIRAAFAEGAKEELEAIEERIRYVRKAFHDGAEEERKAIEERTRYVRDAFSRGATSKNEPGTNLKSGSTMIESIGQDITDHLHERGGPLEPAPERCCSECEGAIEEGRFHAIGSDVLCDQCVIAQVIKVLEPNIEDTYGTREAFDVLRKFAREMEDGNWSRS